MDWKSFLKVVLINATYAKQLLSLLPFLPFNVRKALEVIIDHASNHSDCIVDLADKLSQALMFGAASSESYPESLQSVSKEINTIRTSLTELGLYSAVITDDCCEDPDDCCKDPDEDSPIA